MRAKLVMLLVTGWCIVMVWQSCRNTQPEIVTSPPFEEIDVARHQLVFNAEEGLHMQMENGTHISIPEGSLVDKNGNPVTGEVELHYREFHSAADKLAAGIPMRYDSAGVECYFESAGMFEIQVYKKTMQTAQILPTNDAPNGEPVYLADGEEVSLDLASYTGGDYNFYQLDNNSRNWVYRGESKAEENTEKQNLMADIEEMPEQPVKPKEYKKGMPVYNFSFPREKVKGLEDFKQVMWFFAGEDEASNPSNLANRWIFSTQWDDFTFDRPEDKPDVYRVTFNAGDKSFTTDLKPVLQGDNYKKAKKRFEKKMKAYSKAKDKVLKQKEMAAKQADFQRALKISGFGIYNIDIYRDPSELIVLQPEYTIPDSEIDIEEATFHLVFNNGRSVINFSKGMDLRFNPNNKNLLLAILPGNKVAVYDSGKFNSLPDEVKSGVQKQFNFDMEVVGDVDDMNQIEGLIMASL